MWVDFPSNGRSQVVWSDISCSPAMGVKASEMGGAILGIAVAGRRRKSMRVNISLQPTIRFNIESRDLRGSDGLMNASAVVAEKPVFCISIQTRRKANGLRGYVATPGGMRITYRDASHFRKCQTSNRKVVQPTDID